MSFLDILGYATGGPTYASVKGPGDVADAVYGDGKQVPNVKGPNTDPRYSMLGALQRVQAQQYADRLPQLQKVGQGMIQSNAQNQLREQQKGIDSKNSAQGMYYSGRRLRQRGEATGQAAQQVGKNLNDFNASLFDTGQALQNNAVSTGLGMAGQGNAVGGLIQNQNQNAMLNSLNQKLTDQSGIGGLAAGVGTGLGTAFGGRR